MTTLISTALILGMGGAGGATAPASERITLTTPTGTLTGTLLKPGVPNARVPVALLISGSGPTDRDGNSAGLPGKNDGLKQLAEALAARGIASVRYDKRGVGESAAAAQAIMTDTAAAFQAEVNDASAWIARLRQDRRFTGVTVVGHSQGALTGMLAIQKTSAQKFVSLSGAGDNIYDVLIRQLTPQVPADVLEDIRSVLGEIRAGRVVTKLPERLAGNPVGASLFVPALQPYLTQWMKHDPAEILSRLKLPALIVVGGIDDRAGPNDLSRLANIRPNVRGVAIDGMSHPLKQAQATQESQLRAYTDPTVPLAPGLADTVANFITGK